jgi:hypothetical protein
MSRLNEILYFAPGVRFRDVDLTGNRLPKQIYQRVDGFYIKPAIELARSNQAFASGLLSVCAMDHMGYLLTGANGSRARFMDFCKRIPDLAAGDTPRIFYEDFRCGLVHAAHIDSAGEFDLDAEKLAQLDGSRLIVNPLLLARALQPALKECTDNIYKQRGAAKTLANNVRQMFKVELNG